MDESTIDIETVAEELGVTPREVEMLLLFRKITRVVIDPDVPSEEIRKRVFEQVPREELQKALDELRGGLLDDEDRQEDGLECPDPGS